MTEGEAVFLQIGTITVGKDDVDEIMRYLQGASKEGTIVGFGPLPMRMGVAGLHRGSRKPD